MAWWLACRRTDIPPDRGWPVRIAGRPIAIFDVDGQPLAVENMCRHVGNPIDDGFVEDGCVTCPWHGWRYDLRSGDQLTLFGRRRGLRTYPVRTEGDNVLVDIQAETSGKESPPSPGAHRWGDAGREAKR